MSEVRRCGFWEATTEVYHEHFACSGQVLQYARAKGPFTEAMIRKALYWLQRRHPLLQCKFASLDENYNQFVNDHYKSVPDDQKINEIPLRIIAKQDDTHWQRVSEDVLAADCREGNEYLWTATYIQPQGDDDIHDFVFSLHHSISDGKSNAQLLHDLVVYCSEIYDGAEQPGGNQVEPLLPAVEHMIPNAIMKDDETNAALVPKEEGNQKLTVWPFDGDVPLAERRTRNLYRKIDAETMAVLVPRCRKEGVSVNSALVAAILNSVCDLTEEEKRVMFSTAISLRDACDPPVGMEHFGCYVMVMQTFHNLSTKTRFWDLARDCDKALKDEMAAKTEKGFMPASFDKRKVEAGMIETLTNTNKAKHFPGGPVISNLGVLKYKETFGKGNNFRLIDLYFSTTQNAGNFNYLCWALTLHGQLYTCFTYTEPLFSSEKAQAIADSIIETINKAL